MRTHLSAQAALVQALLVALLAAAAVLALPVRAEAAAASGYVTMSGGYMGSTVWRTGAGTIDVQGSAATNARLSMYGGTDGAYASLTFSAPAGESLAVGTYENAERLVDGSAGVDYAQRSSGCGHTVGRFQVLDVTEDLSRLWIRYEMQCPWDVYTVFGEVRLGIDDPADTSGAIVVPGALTWASEYPKLAAPDVRVTLVNTADAPLTVSQVAVTAGGSDFSVRKSACTTVPVGGSCAVDVGFKPTAKGARAGTLTFTDSSAAGTHVVPLSGTGYAANTSWSTYNPGTEGAETYKGSWTPANSVLKVSGDERSVSLDLEPTNDQRNPRLRLRAPAGSRLEAGATFTGAEDVSFGDPAKPGIDYIEYSTSCSYPTGSFTVHEAEYASTGRVTRFSATYMFDCGSYGTWGSVAWRANAPAAPIPGIVGVGPEAVQNLTARSGYDAVTVSWTNPRTPDWSRTIVRGAKGSVPPASPTQGFAVYSGTGTSKKVTDLLPGGTSYAFSAFAMDSEPKPLSSKRVSVVVSGTALTMAASKTSVAFFSDVTFRGRLVSARTGNVLADKTVGLWAQRPGSDEWLKVTSGKTGADGRYALTFAPAIALDYFVFFDGSGRALGTGAGPIRVKVTSGADVAVDRTSAPLGTTVHFGAVVGPAAPGKTVKLQRLVAGKWTTVQTKTLVKDKATFFDVRPGARGTFKYRIYKAGTTSSSTAVSRTVTLTVT